MEKRDNVTFVAGDCRDVSLPGERDGMNRGHQEAVRWIEAKDELSAMRRLLREIAEGVDSSRWHVLDTQGKTTPHRQE